MRLRGRGGGGAWLAKSGVERGLDYNGGEKKVKSGVGICGHVSRLPVYITGQDMRSPSRPGWTIIGGHARVGSLGHSLAGVVQGKEMHAQ